MDSSIIKAFSVLSIMVLTLAGALLVWSMVVFLRNLLRWRDATTKPLNPSEATDYLPGQRGTVLPPAIISKIRELDEYRDVMTQTEWQEQIQLIITHYFETQKQTACSNPIEGLEGSEVQKTVNTLIRSRKEGVITKTTFEKKLYELLFKRKWPAG
jgi:hypothetical protein